MKYKYFFSIVLPLLFFLISGHGYSQRILGAVTAGLNLTQVDGDEEYGYKKVGLNVGPSVIIPFGKNKKWSFSMELLFSQLGSRQRSQYQNDTVIDTTKGGYYDGYRLKLTYVQIPLMVHFTDKRIIAGGLGLLWGQLVDVREWEDYNDGRGWYRTNTNLKGPYQLWDLEAVADVRLRLWQRLWLDVRYSYSIFPIRTREFVNPYNHATWIRKQYNNIVTLKLTYIFNEETLRKEKNKTE